MNRYEPYRTGQERDALEESYRINDGFSVNVKQFGTAPNPPVPDLAGVKQWAYLKSLGYTGSIPTRREAARLIHELEAGR